VSVFIVIVVFGLIIVIFVLFSLFDKHYTMVIIICQVDSSKFLNIFLAVILTATPHLKVQGEPLAGGPLSHEASIFAKATTDKTAGGKIPKNA